MENGSKYNMWTVVAKSEKGKRHLLCECVCGKQKNIDVYSLKSGASKSCGCAFVGKGGPAPLDLTGSKWGMLTAVERVSSKAEGNKWLYSCDCGGTKVAISSGVKLGSPNCCGCTTKASLVEVGMKFSCPTGEFEIIERLTGDHVKVRFVDGYSYRTTKGNVRTGSVRNPFAGVTYGVGYVGIGEYVSHGEKAYEYWAKMLQRAYCPIYKRAHPTYEGVVVCDEWHNYQNFTSWIVKQVGYGDLGYNLDKDRLVKGNKVYGPEFCLLLPQELNKIIAPSSKQRGASPVGTSTRPDLNGKYMARFSRRGESGTYGEIYLGLFPNAHEAFLAYKVAKEAYIKERADFWRDKMDPRAYDALVSYEIEETD